MLSLDRQRLETALGLLGELLAAGKKDAFHLVVCGGSALIAQGVVSRATQDVDVLAQRNWDHEIQRVHPLPPVLAEAVRQVADELDLPENWLNSAASFHFPDFHALPESFWTDLETRDYGRWLQVAFVGRSGQILLKLYASLNRTESRDFEDLKALAPDARETEDALRWVLREIPGLTHRERLPELVTYLGHAGLDERFQK